MVTAVLIVHAESSIYMAQVVMVIQLCEGLIRQLCFAMEALEQMVTWLRTQSLDGQKYLFSYKLSIETLENCLILQNAMLCSDLTHV